VSTGGIQQLLELPPAPESARAARRFVADVLASAGAHPFVDTAALLTSELVTNGIMHAHTELTIVVEATRRWARVEVVDSNPSLPMRRGYDENATTGRGLEMVELLADEFGVEPLPDGGKRCWFRLGAVPGSPDPAADDPADTPAASTARVELQNLPVALYCAWQPHAEALLREATLVALDDDPVGRGDFPLAGRALSALAKATAELFRLRDDDVSMTDQRLDLDADAVAWVPILRELLVHATERSAAGELLVPPSLPELDALRDWICDEIARQSAGLPATPWADYDSEDAVPLLVAPETLAGVRTAATAQLAADAANRIVAVSQAAAELLGWEPAELEGRRLVAVIPPRLRDRHVAGFTRYLLEGTSEILDRPLTLSALRRDGSEVEVVVRIEQRSDPATRALFVAYFQPANIDG
jgi:PAS domain S-box-containing protein